MSERNDMDAPVTRRELHNALEIWVGALSKQITQDVITQVKALLNVLEDELRAGMRGIEDALGTRLGAFQEHYKDVPGRVSRLEATVFGSPPKRKRRAAR